MEEVSCFCIMLYQHIPDSILGNSLNATHPTSKNIPYHLLVPVRQQIGLLSLVHTAV
jgi:hypothetical protein